MHCNYAFVAATVNTSYSALGLYSQLTHCIPWAGYRYVFLGIHMHAWSNNGISIEGETSVFITWYRDKCLAKLLAIYYPKPDCRAEAVLSSLLHGEQLFWD